MVLGLKALHDLKVCHRDIKSANIFFNAKEEVKMGDFNVSKVVKKGMCYTQTGTPYYASPEVWKDRPYDAKSDIWSLGCVLYEIIALSPPFKSSDMKGLYKKVVNGDYPSIPSRYSNDLSQVVKAML
jgi:NIMA (never in mitosis gene a)-related kinase